MIFDSTLYVFANKVFGPSESLDLCLTKRIVEWLDIRYYLPMIYKYR